MNEKTSIWFKIQLFALGEWIDADYRRCGDLEATRTEAQNRQLATPSMKYRILKTTTTVTEEVVE